MRVIEKTIYQFDELTNSAKEKARGWFRTASAHDTWWSEYEYQMPDECVDESIRANGYEFDEDGEPA